MTGNKSYISDYEEIDGGFVAFGGWKQWSKDLLEGKIRRGKLDFEDVYFAKELKFNLFSLTDENHVLLKVPRKDNMYSVNLRKFMSSRRSKLSLSAKATWIESNLWHRRAGAYKFQNYEQTYEGKSYMDVELVKGSETQESEVDRVVPELATGCSKRNAEEELDQESSKRQKTVPEQVMNVEALQTKYPIIDWEIYTEGNRKYWKIIRVGNHTENQQMTKKERYSASCVYREGNRHLHAGREGVSIVKRNSYIDAGSKALGGLR
ncbi:hypothetical protein Tco_1037802 [Tanacetum coccineum]